MSSADLLPITKELYQQMLTVAWMMIGPLFLLSIVMAHVKHAGQPPVLDLVHRTVITIFLLTFFPEISSAIADIANGLADRLGEKHAMDLLFNQLKQNADPANQANSFSFILKDWTMSAINYICYALPFIAWYLMKALYHFLWSLLSAIAPLAILCNLFPGLSNVTRNLFGSLLEIASWNVFWQVMAVMLFGLKYVHPSGNYFDAISFNIFIAIGLIAVPFIVHSFVRNGLTSPGTIMGAAGVAAIPVMKAKLAYSIANGGRKTGMKRVAAMRRSSQQKTKSEAKEGEK